MKHGLLGMGLAAMAALVLLQPSSAFAQFDPATGIPGGPAPKPRIPTASRIPVVKPKVTVKVNLNRPIDQADAQPTPEDLLENIVPSEPVVPAVRTASAPVKDVVEKIVTGIPLPPPRPALTLGRPVLFEAPRVPNMITLLIDGDAGQIGSEYDLEIVERTELAMFDAQLIKMRAGNDEDVAEIVKKLIADGRVLGAQPDYLFELQQATAEQLPASALASLQYAPKKMGVDTAHSLTRGENTKIAVIDTGIDNSHSVFAQSRLNAFDAIGTPSAEPEPHGTAIAGLIAANKDMLGIAPGADVLIVRAFAQDADGKFTSDSYVIAKAIDWAVAQGAQVINMSFAGPGDPLILKMMDLLSERDVLVVAAAGNSGAGAPAAYPAAHPHAIAVTATDVSDALYANANRGSYVTIAAPGVDVIAPAPHNGYEMVSGTSIATAHMSGILALMLSESADLKRGDVVDLLQRTAEDKGAPGLDPEFGLGLVNAFRATTALKDAG